MKLKNSLLIVAIAFVAAGAILGASAFTTLSVDRNSTIDVVSDDSGIVALSPGSSPFVTLQNGQLSIDTTNGGASGVNVESVLEIGDSAAPTTEYAYSITNNDGNARTLNLSYSGVAADSDSGDNVKFAVVDSSGTSVGTFTENSDLSIQDAPSGETYYVVLTVDTIGSTTADDLSGTVSITAE